MLADAPYLNIKDTQMTERTSIKFILGGKIVELENIEPTMTVLEFLRSDCERPGTKEGCAEGDCGACTVAIGTLQNGSVQYRAVNACIQFLPTLDGCHLLTVEDIRQPDGALHPVQKEMVRAHGSQCGFCTPGFIMSMYVLWRNEQQPSRRQIEDALAGNLCRCTGYGPIVDAMQAAAAHPAVLAHEDAIAGMLEEIQPGSMLRLERSIGSFTTPVSAAEFAAAYKAWPDATILGGGTDVGLWVTKMNRKLPHVIYTGQVAELLEIRETEEAFRIGGAVRYSDLPEALSAAYPDFGEVLRRIGSTQVRNLGTLGGNIANGSPIGDTPPLLIAIGASLVLNDGGNRRALPIEDFFIDYGKQDRNPGEFLETVIIPKPARNWQFAAYKISKRFDQDISAVCAAFNLLIENGTVLNARIAFGGMAATPKRATAAETALTGGSWTSEAVEAACAALAEDFQPITDMRASAEYRLTVAQNLLRKFHAEHTAPLAITRVLA